MGRRPGGQAPALPDRRFAEALRHHQAGRFKEANDICQQILAGNSRDLNALHLTGLISLQVGLNDVAVNVLTLALAVDERVPQLHNSLGEALQRLGRLDEARRHYRRALTLNPGYAEAHGNLGNMLWEQRDPEGAMACYRQALALRPDYAMARHNLGVVLLDQGRLDEAIESFKRALAINPGYAEAHNNLGVALRLRGELEAAITSFRRALALNPDYFDAHHYLGIALCERGDLEAAVASYRQALALNPTVPETLANLGGTLRAQDLLGEAIAMQRAALSQRPGMPLAEVELIHAQSLACDWSDAATWKSRLLAAAQQPGSVQPFILLTQGVSAAEQLFCARQAVGTLTARPVAKFDRSPRPPQSEIRLAYLSTDFRDDVVGMLIPELIERHDRNRFEVAAYCYGPDDSGEMRQRLRTAFDRFEDVPKSDVSAAQQIHANGADILIDLLGYCGRVRLNLLAHRPAPIQVNYLGYPGSMGSRFIDYAIVDSHIVPMDQQAFYDEQLVHLPDCYQPSDTRRQIGPTPSRTECGLPEDGFVFCCFNNSYKIAPPFFDIWMRLLQQVPGSVLWLLKTHALVEQNLRREAAARGVEPKRLVFAEHATMSAYPRPLAHR